MPPTNTTDQLADYEQQYRELAAQLANIGMIHSGSVTRRYTRCATPGCKCHADPPQPHGPYYQWTAKLNGKTVTRRISEREAELYQEWIANDRQLRDLIYIGPAMLRDFDRRGPSVPSADARLQNDVITTSASQRPA